MSEIPERLLPFCSYPAKVLSFSTRVTLSKHLNPEQDCLSASHLLKDWRGVAEFMEFSPLDIENFMRVKNPTSELLRQWTSQGGAKIGVLLNALEAIERYDILDDGPLVSCIEKDCLAHQKAMKSQNAISGEASPIQDDTVSSPDEERYITVGEAATGIPEYFDAFVCYTIEDEDFVQQMRHRLETIEGLKLCITERDLLPGCAKYVIMAKLIEDRCRKMIIVLSPDYINSKECEFQTRFAHALAPGAKEKKLIPVIYRQCKIPSILNHICYVDYTRINVEDWFWTRLANSLKAPLKGNTSPFTVTQLRTPGNATYEQRSTATSTTRVPTGITANGTSTAVLPSHGVGGGKGGGGGGGKSWSSPTNCPGVPTAEVVYTRRNSGDNSLMDTGSWTDLTLGESLNSENLTSGTFETTSQNSTPGYDATVACEPRKKKGSPLSIGALFRKLTK